MPYVVIRQSPRYKQITFDDILSGEIDVSTLAVGSASGTRTKYIKNRINKRFLEQFDIEQMTETLKNFNEAHRDLFDVDREKLYGKFHIPKKSGGLREINAPVPELMEALRQLKVIFESQFGVLYHTSSYAYVKGRSTIDAVKRHKNNASRWFAKLDFHDFFGSTTEDFVIKMFSQIFPFCEIIKCDGGFEALQKALSLCFLNGGLPQGTPISPTITNVMMIPIDHYLSNSLRKRKENFVYTRYADDILISSQYDFNCGEVQSFVLDVLNKFEAPFKLNTKKTRYGSSAGSNWNLGVMLNKDNEITIGYKNKKYFKAMCCNYINDRKNNVRWGLHDVQVFSGKISYYKMIEKDYINYVIDQYNKKFSVNMEELIKEDLRCPVRCSA